MDRQQAVSLRMQSSFDLPIGDSSSRELLQEDELMANNRMMSVDDADEEEAQDNFEMGSTATGSRNDLEIQSPIQFSMLSPQELLMNTQGMTRGGQSSEGSDPVPLTNNIGLTSRSKGRGDSVSGKNCNAADGVEGGARGVPRRARKMVEFATLDDNDNSKQKRSDSTGDAAIQAKIFAEIKK